MVEQGGRKVALFFGMRYYRAVHQAAGTRTATPDASSIGSDFTAD